MLRGFGAGLFARFRGLELMAQIVEIVCKSIWALSNASLPRCTSATGGSSQPTLPSLASVRISYGVLLSLLTLLRAGLPGL